MLLLGESISSSWGAAEEIVGTTVTSTGETAELLVLCTISIPCHDRHYKQQKNPKKLPFVRYGGF